MRHTEENEPQRSRVEATDTVPDLFRCKHRYWRALVVLILLRCL
jgi:hypothetical protein